MIKVLIVNDSLMVQQFLKRIVETDTSLVIVGIAKDGFVGVQYAIDYDPDVVLMDIRMPGCDGVEATKQIMLKSPRPILIVTATVQAHMSYIYDCLNYGALEVIKTPILAHGFNKSDINNAGTKLLRRIRVVHSLRSSINKRNKVGLVLEKREDLASRPRFCITGKRSRKVIVIGASTGGPQTILKILKSLPMDINAGLILVQHIDADFANGLAEWFHSNCQLDIFAAKDGDSIVNGTGYLAAKCKNLVVNSSFSVEYQDTTVGVMHIPSIDVTFESVAAIYGKNAVGVLLTGMGADGAKGLKAIREVGGRTIAQDEKTSIVYGMPKVARDMDAAEFILPLDQIVAKIAGF